MNKLGRNTLALGVSTLLITSAVSFSANAAENYESYGQAQYVLGAGALDGNVIDPLVDNVVESPTTDACEPTEEDCPESDSTESPLGDALAPLTTGLGDALGGINGTGVVGNYASAKNGTSYAASGAVSNEGVIDLGSDTDPSSPTAVFGLSSGALEPVANAVADLRLEIGAASAAAKLVPGDDDSFPAPAWSAGNTVTPTSDGSGLDYNIAGADVVLEVPALQALNPAIGGVIDDALASEVNLNAETVCELLEGVGEALTVDVPVLGELDLCTNLATITGALGPDFLNAEITGLDSITGGLENITNDGITFDFTEGEIRIDLAVAAESVLGTDINELAPNTEILGEVLSSLTLNLDTLVASLYDDLVADIIENVGLTVTLAGTELPAIDLSTLGEAGLSDLLSAVFGGLSDGLETVGDPLSEALSTITGQLAPLVELTVNVPDYYAEIQQADGNVGTTAADTVYSNTALRLTVLGVGGDATLVDLLLGNALVGPNAVVEAADDLDVDGTDVDLDGTDNDAQADADAVADADSDAQADAAADADAQADADVTTTLPATGAPNLLPFWLLGLGLVLFGAAVLINERRRLKI